MTPIKTDPTVPTKSDSCTCVNCKCDPCECKDDACCGISKSSCSNSWCNWHSALRITIAVWLLVGAFYLGVSLTSHGRLWDSDDSMQRGRYDSREGMPIKMNKGMRGDSDDMREHCKTMPAMMGCEAYVTGTSMMDMADPMTMSMADMSKMMVGKTGDELDRAFLEGMIPHHQGAVDMAKMMAGSRHPELVKFAGDIIAGQSREIEQMRQWMKDWGYVATGSTSSGTMMNMTGMMMR